MLAASKRSQLDAVRRALRARRICAFAFRHLRARLRALRAYERASRRARSSARR